MYPSELDDKEKALINSRRKVAGVEESAPRIGIACSGGGIRSATVCLGVFQAFAKSEVLPRIDYISTISGGGYFGSFLGSLYLPRSQVEQLNDEQKEKIPKVVSKNLSDDQSAPVKWLRRHGRYVAPNGPADYANIVAIYLRNWIGVQYVIGITFLTLFLFSLLIRAWVSPYYDSLPVSGFDPVRWSAFLSPFLIIPLLVFLIASAPLGWSFWLTQYGTNRDGIEADSDIGGWKVIAIAFKNNKALWASFFVLGVCAMTLLTRSAEGSYWTSGAVGRINHSAAWRLRAYFLGGRRAGDCA